MVLVSVYLFADTLASQRYSPHDKWLKFSLNLFVKILKSFKQSNEVIIDKI